MIKKYLLTFIHNKTTVWVILALLCYSTIPIFNLNFLAATAWEKSPSFFNANYAAYFFYFGVIFFTIPLFYIFLQPNRIFFENNYIIIRFKSYRQFWRHRTLIAIWDSIVYVIFIYLLIFLRAIYFKQSAQFFQGLIFYIKAAILQIITFYLLAMIFFFLSYLTGHQFISFACSYFLIIYDYAAMQTGIGRRLFILETISVIPENMEVYIPCLIVIVLISILFYLFSSIVVSNKDQLKREAG